MAKLNPEDFRNNRDARTCHRCGSFYILVRQGAHEYRLFKSRKWLRYCTACINQIIQKECEKRHHLDMLRDGRTHIKRIEDEQQRDLEAKAQKDFDTAHTTPEEPFYDPHIIEIEGDLEGEIKERLSFKVVDAQYNRLQYDRDRIWWKIKVEEGGTYRVFRYAVFLGESEEEMEKTQDFRIANYRDTRKLTLSLVPKEWVGKKLTISAYFQSQEEEGKYPIPQITSQIKRPKAVKGSIYLKPQILLSDESTPLSLYDYSLWTPQRNSWINDILNEEAIITQKVDEEGVYPLSLFNEIPKPFLEVLSATLIDSRTQLPLRKQEFEILGLEEIFSTNSQGYFEINALESQEYEIRVEGISLKLPTHEKGKPKYQIGIRGLHERPILNHLFEFNPVTLIQDWKSVLFSPTGKTLQCPDFTKHPWIRRKFFIGGSYHLFFVHDTPPQEKLLEKLHIRFIEEKSGLLIEEGVSVQIPELGVKLPLDSSGCVCFTNLPAKDYEVWIGEAKLKISTLSLDSPIQEHEVAGVFRQSMLYYQLNLEEKTPLENWELQLESPQGKPLSLQVLEKGGIFKRKTSQDGKYRFQLPNEEIFLQKKSNFFLANSPDSPLFQFQILENPEKIHFILMGNRYEAPLIGVEVKIIDFNLSLFTDAKGAIYLNQIPQGEYEIQIGERVEKISSLPQNYVPSLYWLE